MGVNSSSIVELKDNEYLRRFAGKEHISHNDPFWNQMLSFTFSPPRQSSDYKILEDSTHSLCKILLTNNLQTGNVGSLLRVFLVKAVELKASTQCEDAVSTWQAYNALFILRCICKYFLETITEDSFLKQLQARPQHSKKEIDETCNDDEEQQMLLEHLQTVLVELIVDVPVTEMTYSIHVEATNTILVLLSVQMFTQNPAVKSSIYRAMMAGKCSNHACHLMKKLLKNYIRQEKWPANLHHGGSVILNLASGLWSILTLGYGSGQPAPNGANEALLANQSLLLVLVLANHCTNEKTLQNPYRQALFSFTNNYESSPANRTQTVTSFEFDYPKLFSALCQTVKDDQTTLLLYLLLHRNNNFSVYVLARTDIDELIVPLLKILYKAQDRSSHHIYMALIILLILSEDDCFNKAIHDIVLKNVSWYTDRTLYTLSLGGLLVLVVIRTIQFNMTRMRDKYLHTNCLAALANMSGQFRNLHYYVSQRLVGLFESLAKRHLRLVEQLQTSTESANGIDDHLAADLQMQDLAVLEEVLRMVLEIINSCLVGQLAHNTNLVYTLLYKRECFEQFRNHPTFQDIIQNIETVLTYFSSRLESADGDLSVHQVLQIIHNGVQEWPINRLKKFPDLKFKYVEEDQPEEFFIPYVWSLVHGSSYLYWNASNVRLFTVTKADQVTV